MHWSLDQVDNLDVDVYAEVFEWHRDRSPGDEDGVDMDKVIDAAKAKDGDAY